MGPGPQIWSHSSWRVTSLPACVASVARSLNGCGGKRTSDPLLRNCSSLRSSSNVANRTMELSDAAFTGGCSASADHSRSEEHTSELQSHVNLVCRLLLEKKN